MNDLGSVVLAFCGIGVVCGGALGLLLFLVARFTGGSLFISAIATVGNLFWNNDEVDEGYDLEGRAERRPGVRTRLKDKRQAMDLDFESAVARHQSGDPNEPLPPDTDPPATPSLRNSPEPPPLGNRPPRRDRRRQEFHEDEIFGGMLDDEGDGYPDY